MKKLVMGIVLARLRTNSAGHQLSVLHWLHGFRELGWDIWIVENLVDQCRDSSGKASQPQASTNVEDWRRFVA